MNQTRRDMKLVSSVLSFTHLFSSYVAIIFVNQTTQQFSKSNEKKNDFINVN